jgi:hypothetical protein
MNAANCFDVQATGSVPRSTSRFAIFGLTIARTICNRSPNSGQVPAGASMPYDRGGSNPGNERPDFA